jgi:tetratricopeptide (TPR) repeat protein
VYFRFWIGNWKSRFSNLCCINGQGRRDFVNRRGFGQTRLFARDRLRGDLTVAVAVVAALCSCQPQSVREEKALRAQLSHELRHHSYESAIPLARRVIRIAPQDKRAWKKLVAAQIGLHDLDGAKQTLAEWRRTVRPLSSRVDELEGDIAREESDFDSARRAWEKAVAVQPKNRRVWEKIATVEQRDQQWAKAIASWTRALQIKDNATARINRAVCRRRLRQWTEAFEDLHHAQKLAADDPDVRRWSRLFENVSKFVDEIREVDARVAAIADDPGLLADRALLLLRSGDPELALDDSEQAIKLAPWAIRPKLFKALALIALNRAKECENLSIRQPLRLEWLTPEFLETISRIDSAISVERDNPDHYTARAWQLNEIGQPMLAFADAQTAVRLDAKSANGWAEVSYALTKLGRGQEAFEKIKQATELDPSLASAWQYRGELEMAHGDNLAAVDSLSHALAIQQTVAGLQKRAECYERLGLRARADEDHRAIQDLTSRSLR